MNVAVPADRVASVRAFNRFYTGVIGAVAEGHLETPYSLAEARVIYELAQRDGCAVTDLRRDLDLDAGYLSRILTRLDVDGLVVRERATDDARRQVVRLTERGRVAFADLDERTAERIGGLLSGLPEPDQRRLVGAMRTIEGYLGGAGGPASYVLRPLEPGDLGWVVRRNAVLYAAEYGWDGTYETLVARIVADFAEKRGPGEDAWIAEVAGEPVGCVFCVRDGDHVARLRLLLVEPSVRGMGIGARLVEECLRFARRAGYREMVLWTNDVLTEARRIYQRAGFELIEEEPHHSFGTDLVGQTWRLTL